MSLQLWCVNFQFVWWYCPIQYLVDFFLRLSCFLLILSTVLDAFLISSLESSLLLDEYETVNISSSPLSLFSDFICTILISFSLGGTLWNSIEGVLVGVVYDLLEFDRHHRTYQHSQLQRNDLLHISFIPSAVSWVLQFSTQSCYHCLKHLPVEEPCWRYGWSVAYFLVVFCQVLLVETVTLLWLLLLLYLTFTKKLIKNICLVAHINKGCRINCTETVGMSRRIFLRGNYMQVGL